LKSEYSEIVKSNKTTSEDSLSKIKNLRKTKS